MDETQRKVDEIRKERSELENHLIDEYSAGRISRREFVRRGTIIGMSIPLVAWLAAACGGGSSSWAATTAGTGAERPRQPAPAAQTTETKPGGTIKLGLTTPAGQLNPVTVDDQGGSCLNAQTGEFLALSLGEREADAAARGELEAERGLQRRGRSRSARE